MNKLASEDINATMIKAAGALRSLQAENDSLRAELDRRDRADHAQKIASQARDRGMMGDTEANEYANSLAQGDHDLNMVEDMISNTAAGYPLGTPLAKTASADGASSDAVLTNFLLSEQITSY